jgi:hypothetical protein
MRSDGQAGRLDCREAVPKALKTKQKLKGCSHSQIPDDTSVPLCMYHICHLGSAMCTSYFRQQNHMSFCCSVHMYGGMSGVHQRYFTVSISSVLVSLTKAAYAVRGANRL